MRKICNNLISITQTEGVLAILIIGITGHLYFSKINTKKTKFEDCKDLISGFITAFNDFSGELFSKGLDRAKFGEYLLLMEPLGDFSVCYLFKGQTFLAKQKLNKFAEHIQNTPSILETFNNYFKINRIVQLKDFPSLDSLISEIFLH